ncbi:MAG: ApaG domain [Alphaproteobacteria bacterium]|nr:ApaG domain [Alphaproteobacteria bacterium]
MFDNNEIDYFSEQTEDITVEAFPEQLDTENSGRELWAFCLRIENNSDKRICLTKQNFCITDSYGHNQYYSAVGFNGELPDLEPGEYFEYEDTATFEGNAAVLYGFCEAVNSEGTPLKIKLPLMQLSTILTKTSHPIYH